MRGHNFRLLVVWTALAFIGQPAARAYREPSHPRAVSVNFSLYSDYLIVVRGSAGPLKDLNFLLDTGTSPTILNQSLARRLHLDPAPAIIAVLNGNVQGAMAIAPSLQFGPIRKDNLPVLIRDLSALELPVPIDGIVGLDVLGQSNFVIDYTSQTISFGAAASSMPGSIPLQLKDGLAIVDATVNHAPVHLVLDTGAPSLVLFAAASDPAPQLVRAALPKTLGHVEHKPIRLASFSLGPSEFGREPAFLVSNPADAGHHYDGLLSPTALGITRLAIDLTHHTLVFTRTP